MEGYFIFHTARFGEVQGWFGDGADRNRREVIAYVMERLPERPGVKYYSGEEDRSKEEDKKSAHSVVINGEDKPIMYKIILKALQIMDRKYAKDFDNWTGDRKRLTELEKYSTAIFQAFEKLN